MTHLPATLYARYVKHWLERTVAGCALIILSPLFALVAVAIKAETRGAVLYKQERVGRDGELFDILKFRTMLPLKTSFDSAGQPLANYDRVTRVGRILRRTSLDELPQLANVLMGSMALVGPRPTLKYQVERYTEEQRRRLLVRPGITGLAQVRGRNSLSWDEKIAFDLEYVRRLSLLTDLKILVGTVGAVVGRSGVEFGSHDSISRHDRDYRDDI